MRGGKYNAGDDSNMMYDDSAFQLFAVAFLAVYWVPVALYRLFSLIRRVRHVKTPIEQAKEEWCGCSLCQDKADKIRAKTAGMKGLTIGDFVFGFITLLLIFTSLNVYRSNMRVEPPFDPFSILNVARSATERDIKKAYRRLSVVHHPDKNRNDPSAGDRFIKISKAFAALTDEASKENYIKYGNPDGYVGTTWGLGLPRWVGEKQQMVLLAYGVFMVLIFPAMVGYWWRKREQQMTSEIMKSTFVMFCETLSHTTRFRDLLSAFCAADEFNSTYSSNNDDAVRHVNECLRKKLGGLPKSKCVFEPSLSQVQNLLIITAYLEQIELPESLKPVLETLLTRAEPLLTSMADIVGVFQRSDCKAAWDKQFMRGHTTLLSRCLQLTHCIYQGVEEKASPLMQIPHFTERELKFCMSRSGVSRTVYDLMRLDMDELSAKLRAFDDAQILDVKAFCDRYPLAMLEVEPPCVEGEDDSSVHEGDRVTVRTTLRVLRKSGSAFSPHVPHLPYRKEEVWWLWLADQKRLCPIEVKRLLPRMARGHDGTKRTGFDAVDEEEGDAIFDDEQTAEERERRRRREEEVERLAADPRVTVFEVMFQFTAPRAGSYALEVKAVCDCYTGTAKSVVLRMDVLEAVEVEEEEVRFSSDEEDDSDEESEDSDEEEGSANENDAEGDEEGADSDDDYEYIEVTESASEGGDFDDDDDDDDCFGVSGAPHGDPAES